MDFDNIRWFPENCHNTVPLDKVFSFSFVRPEVLMRWAIIPLGMQCNQCWNCSWLQAVLSIVIYLYLANISSLRSGWIAENSERVISKPHTFFYTIMQLRKKLLISQIVIINRDGGRQKFNYRENGEPSKLQHPVNGKLTTTAGTTSELHKDVYIISPKSSFLPVGIFFFSCMLIKYKGAFFMFHASGCYLSYQLKFILSQRQ